MITVKKEGVLLEPTEHKFENHGVFNPACIESDEKMHLLYRATSKGNYSTIGYCRLLSPLKIAERHESPLLIPHHNYESQGIEDPRIVKIDGTYFLTYTAYDGSNALGALATSKDMKTFEKAGIITPQMTYKEFQQSIECSDCVNEKHLRFVKLFYERGGAETAHKLLIWDKDVIFFPKKINGKFAFLHRIYPDIQVVYFNDIKELTAGFWKEYMFNIKKYTVLESKMHFEASYIGGGCPPVETKDGWLMIYHGVEDTKEGYVYHAGAALLDLNDPTKEIGRLKYPLFSPESDWEKHGVVNNVVFPTGTILKDGILYIYYGAADKRIGVASVNLNQLINEIKNQN
jgi:predicted GH43/DUF377 family glycosyl hydrolase